MVIFSRNGTFRSKLNQAFDTTPTGIAECFSALNIFLSITASLGNVLILIALRKISSIYLGLRYRHVVTLTRVRVVIICIWLIGTSAGIIRLWSVDISLHEVTVIVTLSLVVSFFSYTMIHLKLRHQQAQVQNQFRQRQPNVGRIPLNIARYKKILLAYYGWRWR